MSVSLDLSFQDDGKLSYADRAELLEKGPYHLVFHGIESDWMEEEMADDPDFKRDVLEQRIKKIIKDEVRVRHLLTSDDRLPPIS